MTLFGFDLGPDRIAIGLFTGLVYGLLAIGLVLAYRSSRFVNFAHGSIGVFGAAVLARLATTFGLPYWVAFPIAVAVAGLLGAGTEATVVRRLADRPRAIGMIATLGLSEFILVLALLVDSQAFSGSTFPKPPGLPTFHVGTTEIGASFTAMLLLTPVLLGLVAIFLRYTRYGIGIRAAADHPDAATVNGVTAPRMASMAWAVAGGVAAFSAILLTPTQGVQSIDSLGPELLLRGLAGAVIARMASLPVAFASSLFVGILEKVLLSKESSGFVDVVLALVILVALLRQRRIGRRAEPDIAWKRAVPTTGFAAIWGTRAGLALTLLAGVGLAYVVSNATASILTQVLGYALVALSISLVTGLAGELSLGQFAFAGIAAAVSVRTSVATGNLFVGVLAGCATGALAAVIVGIPALRLRGIALGLTTLAFALATSGWLLRQPWLLGDGLETPYPAWHGYALSVAKDYYLFALVLFVLGWWVTVTLRQGGFGRLLVALRDNEDAGRALTVAPALRKLQAYAVCGALAGLGGVVIGYGQSQLTVNSFPASASIDVVAIAVVGGMAVSSGALLGSLVIVGLPALLPLGIIGEAALTLGWLLVVILLPGGLGGLIVSARDRLLSRYAIAEEDLPPASGQTIQRVSSVIVPPASSTPLSESNAWGIGVMPARRGAVENTDYDDRDPLLEVSGIRRAFGGVRAVDDASLAVFTGEIVGIIGPNGAGKTTLFEILAGFTPAEGGSVVYNGRLVTSWTPERRAKAGLVRSFQDARLFPAMTVREAVMVAAESAVPLRLAAAALGATKSEAGKAARADEALQTMGLSGYAHRTVGELSTGTRRLVELCSLLALEPRLLLLDEPSSGLTQADGTALGELLLRVRDELGTTILVIEHDLPLLGRIADRLIAMDAGRVIAEGPPNEVRSHPDVVLSYLGTDEAAVARSGAPAG